MIQPSPHPPASAQGSVSLQGAQAVEPVHVFAMDHVHPLAVARSIAPRSGVRRTAPVRGRRAAGRGAVGSCLARGAHYARRRHASQAKVLLLVFTRDAVDGSFALEVQPFQCAGVRRRQGGRDRPDQAVLRQVVVAMRHHLRLRRRDRDIAQHTRVPMARSVVGWGTLSPSLAAWTYVWYSVTGSQRVILDADVTLSVTNIVSLADLDRLMTHEWGHALGSRPLEHRVCRDGRPPGNALQRAGDAAGRRLARLPLPIRLAERGQRGVRVLGAAEAGLRQHGCRLGVGDAVRDVHQ